MYQNEFGILENVITGEELMIEIACLRAKGLIIHTFIHIPVFSYFPLSLHKCIYFIKSVILTVSVCSFIHLHMHY